LSKDIINDVEFTKSNEIFYALTKNLKNKGMGSTKHFDVLEKEDLAKIKDLSASSPKELQWKVWISIMLHFLNRGQENMHLLKKEDLIMEKDTNGKTAIRLRDFKTKNHQGTDTNPSTEAVIYPTGDGECAASLIEFYLTKLHPGNDFFWQKPKPTVEGSDQTWYQNLKLGINTISKFMSEIAGHLKMSKRYTNHCLRATGITALGSTFQDTEVSCFSGHKSLNSLSIYKRTSNKVKEAMCTTLHDCIYPTPLCLPATSPLFENVMEPGHVLPSTSRQMHIVEPGQDLPSTSRQMQIVEPRQDLPSTSRVEETAFADEKELESTSRNTINLLEEQELLNTIDLERLFQPPTASGQSKSLFSGCTIGTINFNFNRQ
jgi:hypothetical protein